MRALRRQRAPAAEEEHGAGMERWLLTYADMITLLLALFVVLFALSTLDAKKFAEFRSGLLPAMGRISPASAGGAPVSSQSIVAPLQMPSNLSAAQNQSQVRTQLPVAPAQSQQNLAELERALARALRRAGVSGDVQLRLETRGLVVRMLSDKIYYAVDSAALGPVGVVIVDTIAGVLAQAPNHVVVEGYTDNQPVLGGPFGSNWALSAMRAVNVVLHLVHVDRFPAGRLAATGYGSTRPTSTDLTPAGQAQNRRVDVVVLAPGVDRP